MLARYDQTDALHNALTQGVDEAMSREQNRLNNFALVAALFLTITVGPILEPPELQNDIMQKVFAGFMIGSTMCFFLTIMFTIHITSLWTRVIHCDADYFQFLLDHNWNLITDMIGVLNWDW